MAKTLYSIVLNVHDAERLQSIALYQHGLSFDGLVQQIVNNTTSIGKHVLQTRAGADWPQERPSRFRQPESERVFSILLDPEKVEVMKQIAGPGRTWLDVVRESIEDEVDFYDRKG